MVNEGTKKMAEGLLLLASEGYATKALHDELRAFPRWDQMDRPSSELVAKMEAYDWHWSEDDECFYTYEPGG
jgi:hypothetical protein